MRSGGSGHGGTGRRGRIMNDLPMAVKCDREPLRGIECEAPDRQERRAGWQWVGGEAWRRVDNKADEDADDPETAGRMVRRMVRAVYGE